MNTLTICCVIMLCLIHCLLQGQELSGKVSFGPSLSRPKSDEYFVNQDIREGSGWFINGGVAYQFNKHWGMETGVSFEQQRYNIINNDYANIKSRISNSLIEMPLDIKYSTNRNWLGSELYFFIGPYASYWISSRINATLPNVFESNVTPITGKESIGLRTVSERVDLNSGYNKWSYGYNFGLGITRKLSGNLTIGVEGRFKQELRSRLADQHYSRWYQSLSVGFIVLHKKR